MRVIRAYLDLLGFSASFLCAIHCMLLPLLLAFGASGGVSWLENPFIEWSFIVSALILAGWSLVGSYREHHDRRPLQLAVAGFLIILGVHILHHAVGHYLAAIGGILIAYAHYLNWRIRRRTEIVAA